ncbi:MAG: hypothetical protein KatS3mg031_1139 [Chitinophagales bacterium]|nr:MAG: hypothetical protein KatS3mg031_1139 [Chitinophagales bacterium]
MIKWLVFCKSVLLFVLLAGCSDDALPEAQGLVVYTGSFASGGCEWIIVIHNEAYEPRNLPVQFQTDSMQVMLTYRIWSRDVSCPNAGKYAGIIHIHQIAPI